MNIIKVSNSVMFSNVQEFKAYIKNVKRLPVNLNRPINRSQVETLKKSILEHGITRLPLIIKTYLFGEMGYYGGDGNHLLIAISETPNDQIRGVMGVVEFEMNRLTDIIKFITVHNATAKTWRLTQYLDTWCYAQNRNYTKINTLYQRTNLPLNGLIEAYSGRKTKGNDDFKNGYFKFNKEFGDHILEMYKSAISCGLYETRSSFLAVTRWLIFNRTIGMDRFLNGISANRRVLGMKMNRDAYMGLLNQFCRPNK